MQPFCHMLEDTQKLRLRFVKKLFEAARFRDSPGTAANAAEAVSANTSDSILEWGSMVVISSLAPVPGREILSAGALGPYERLRLFAVKNDIGNPTVKPARISSTGRKPGIPMSLTTACRTAKSKESSSFTCHIAPTRADIVRATPISSS